MSEELSPKDPDVDAEYGIDFRDQLVSEAAPLTEYDLGDILFFPQDTGFYYEVTTDGRTSRNYPASLPRESGELVTFGSCELTCRRPSEVTLGSIGSASWSIAPTSLTIASQRISGFVAFVTVANGTDGVDYEVTCRITPSSGNQIDKTITIPVRSQ